MRHPSAFNQALHQHLEKGQALLAFSCRTDLAEEMASEMASAGMPYLAVQDTSGRIYFLIRDLDRDKQAASAVSVLKQAGRYCEILDVSEVEKRLLRSKEQDKSVLFLPGLTLGEADYLSRQADRVLGGSMAGLSRQTDGSYLFCCPGRAAMEGFGFGTFGRTGAEAFCLTASEACLLSSGDGSNEWEERALLSRKFQKARSLGFPDASGAFSKSTWIVGDGRRYLHLTEDQFTSGYATVTDSHVDLNQDQAVPQSSPLFQPILNDALFLIPRPVCLSSYEEVEAWFLDHKNRKTYALQTAKLLLARTADPILMHEIHDDPSTRSSGNWGAKFEHYQYAMGRLLKGVKEGKAPRGVSADEIRLLQQTARKGHLSPDTLDAGSERLSRIEVVSRSAERPRIQDIRKYIERFAPEMGEDQNRSRQRGRSRDER